VLCYLEGESHEEAARRLGCPIGTVKGRLARARELLRGRLVRRGLVLPAGAFLVAYSREANAVVPEVLLNATVRAALGFAAGRATAGVISAAAAGLAREVLGTMMMSKLSFATLSVLVTTGVLVWAGQPGQDRPVKLAPAAPKVAGGTPGPAAPPASDPNAQIEAARQTLDAARLEFDDGHTEHGEIQRYIHASKVLSENESDRATAVRAHRDRMKTLEEKLEKRAETQEKIHQQAVADAKYAQAARVAADEWLAKPDRGAKDEPTVAKPRRLTDSSALLNALEKPVPHALAGPLTPPTLENALKTLKTASQTPDLPNGIPIYVDPKGLEEAGQTMQAKVGGITKSVPLGQSLSTILRPLGLAYVVKDGLVTISSREEIAFTEIGQLREELKALTHQLKTPPKPTRLKPQGQPAAGSPALPGSTPGEGQPAVARRDQPNDDEEKQTQAIVAALNKVVPLHFEKAPLEDVIKTLKTATTSPELPQGIPIYLDPNCLQGAPKGPLGTLNLEGVRLKTSLRLLLEQMGLAYTVKEGLLMIVQPNSPELQFGGAMRGMGGMGGGFR